MGMQRALNLPTGGRDSESFMSNTMRINYGRCPSIRPPQDALAAMVARMRNAPQWMDEVVKMLTCQKQWMARVDWSFQRLQWRFHTVSMARMFQISAPGAGGDIGSAPVMDGDDPDFDSEAEPNPSPWAAKRIL